MLRPLVQDYVQKWQGQFSSFSFQARAPCESERSVLAPKMGPFRRVKYSPIIESNLAPLNQGQ